MSDPTPPALPTAVVDPPRRFRIPLVWVIPIVAALIGLFLAARTWYEQGPVVTLQFRTGTGLEPGKTRIKYKDVDVGQISTVRLSDDGSHVVASAQMAREAAPLLVEDTRFWVVSAKVSGSAVSGLDTLLSGTYVGMDAGKSGEARRDFVGLEDAPVVSLGVPGRSFALHADTLGSIDVGTPVYFRRIQAGQVTAFKLDDAGQHLDIQVFIKSPYDRFVTIDTRFWNASGIDLKLGAEGLQLNTESATAILAGGLAFETPPGGDTEAAPAGQDFRLFSTRAEALKQPSSNAQIWQLRFTETLRGLSVGAPVDFRGIQIGEVIAISPDVDVDAADVGLQVDIAVFPERMQSRKDATQDMSEADFRAFVDRLIKRGLRAQLRNGNLVTGQLYVAMDFFPNAGAAKIDWAGRPPQLPTQRGSLDELQATLSRIAAKLDRLPLDDIAAETRRAIAGLASAVERTEALMQRLDGLASNEVRAAVAETQQTMAEARAAVADGRRLLAADAPLQQDLRDSLQELSRAAQSLRHLTDTLERNPEALLRGKPEEKP
ncbi:MAG: MCE family protein [Methyloversatilis discipulorum]|uniref:PqiB family protein n=1 Tax=Methyloversatilis discipulorum TaxID=1119528 RepID=UPI0026F0DD10|nr:MlaD family protein [Methyloversatilis discipulorum]MBV5287088.1 MCE family protein [Methyloversatilis discipulorum]